LIRARAGTRAVALALMFDRRNARGASDARWRGTQSGDVRRSAGGHLGSTGSARSVREPWRSASWFSDCSGSGFSRRAP